MKTKTIENGISETESIEFVSLHITQGINGRDKGERIEGTKKEGE